MVTNEASVQRAVAELQERASLSSYDTAIREYGRSADDVEEWWLSTLAGLVLRQ
jgi:hypothetical protein